MYCLTKEGRHVEEDYCKHLVKPNVQKKCRGGRCPKWKSGDWGQVRLVVYPFAPFDIPLLSNRLEANMVFPSLLSSLQGLRLEPAPQVVYNYVNSVGSSGAALICTQQLAFGVSESKFLVYVKLLLGKLLVYNIMKKHYLFVFLMLLFKFVRSQAKSALVLRNLKLILLSASCRSLMKNQSCSLKMLFATFCFLISSSFHFASLKCHTLVR